MNDSAPRGMNDSAPRGMTAKRGTVETALGGLLLLNLCTMVFRTSAPFIAGKVVTLPALFYALACATVSWKWWRWLLERPRALVIPGPLIGIGMIVVLASFVFSFLAAETGFAAVYTRLAGKAETRTAVVAESVWIGSRKMGADHCHQARLQGYSAVTAQPDALCFEQRIATGAVMRIAGWHSALGSWHTAFEPVPPGSPTSRP